MAVSPIRVASDEFAANYVKGLEDGVWHAAGGAPVRVLAYSDGDELEDRLLAAMHAASDLSAGSEELESRILDFPSSYHLSGNRTFLLRPLAGLLQGRVLEIGAGCGALTRFLGENAAEVIAVEGSPRRAAIAAARCRDLPNVAVVAGHFADLTALGKFDAVTMVGVLEYARSFAASADADPVTALLARARACLRPGGKLVLAIENQLGLKYFAMYPEDHLGEPMAGIENRYGPESAVTFGRSTLRGLLAGAGLKEQQWRFPFPDYKFPTLVLTEAGARAEAGDGFAWAIAQTACRDPQQPARTSFALQRVWPTLWRNGLISELANSFLVVASDAPFKRDERLLATYYGTTRRRSLQKETRFVREPDGVWVRRARMYEGGEDVPGLGLTLSDEPLWKGRVLEEDLIAATGHDGWEVGSWIALLAPWFAALRERFALPPRLEPSLSLPARAMDALPRNLVLLDDGGTRFIDQEWQPDGDVTLGYIFFRALFSTLLSVEQCAPGAPGQSDFLLGLVRLGFDALGWELADGALRSYVEREAAFQTAVNGKPFPDLEQTTALRLRIRPDLERERAQIAELEREAEVLRAERDAIEAAELERRASLEASYRHELGLAQRELRGLQNELAGRARKIDELTSALAQLQTRLDESVSAYDRLAENLIERVQHETRRVRRETTRTEALIQETYGSKWWQLKRFAARLRPQKPNAET